MNKLYRKYLGPFTLILLACLLFIQVRWIVSSIRTQEQIFRRSVNLALSQTINNLNENRNICSQMQACLACKPGDSAKSIFTSAIWNQIGKTIDTELKSYNINLEYDLFIIKDKKDTISRGNFDVILRPGKTCYAQSLGDVLQNSGYELVVGFSGKSKLFFRNNGLMFLSSIFIILLIVISVIYLIKLYRGELQLAENIKELINNISHEFKTPLSSISLAASLIKKGSAKGLSEKSVEYAQLIINENKKLQQQVDSLLNLSVIEHNNLILNRETVNVNNLLKEAADSVEMILLDKGGKINWKLASEEINISCDKVSLLNSFVNLLTNAVKYSGESPEITVSNEITNNILIIRFSDKGIGIPFRYQRFIFDKYFRVPTGNVHDIKGFGIGLSYVKKVVEAHSGNIRVDSTPGKGSTFTINLPVNKT